MAWSVSKGKVRGPLRLIGLLFIAVYGWLGIAPFSKVNGSALLFGRPNPDPSLHTLAFAVYHRCNVLDLSVSIASYDKSGRRFHGAQEVDNLLHCIS